MENRTKKIEKVISFLGIIYGILIVIGPQLLWGKCPNNGVMMKCHYSCKVEIILGTICVAIGCILLSINDYKTFLRVIILEIIVDILIIIVPGGFIGGCSNSEMHCQLVTFPILYALSIIRIFSNMCVYIYCFFKNKKHN